jgi:hypothetical protein
MGSEEGRVIMDYLVTLGHLDFLDSKARQDPQVQMDYLVKREHLVEMVLMELMDSKETLE